MVAGQSAKRTVGHDIRQLRQLIHGVGVRAGHMRHVEDLQQGAIGDGFVGEDPIFHQITWEKLMARSPILRCSAKSHAKAELVITLIPISRHPR